MPLPPTIDCDLHNEVPSKETLYPYLPDYWLDYCRESAFVGPESADYPATIPTSVRPDASAIPGLSEIQEKALGGAEIGILNCAYRAQSVRNEELAAALASAVNRWQVEKWLEKEPRLRASIVVPSQNPALAAAEIERWGDHPGFVQVILPVRSEAPYGNRRYDPIFEAATRHNLVVGINFGGAAGNPPTPAGWPSLYVEEYAGMAQIFQSQATSLVMEGAFDRFPDLRVAFIEGGFTWLPSLMWRMDKEWKGLRHNTPWVKRAPSLYWREHLRLTIQPVDGPANAKHLRQIVEQMDSDEMLLYGSDYPHLHDSENALFATLPVALEQKIRSENARAFYRL